MEHGADSFILLFYYSLEIFVNWMFIKQGIKHMMNLYPLFHLIIFVFFFFFLSVPVVASETGNIFLTVTLYSCILPL